MRLICQMQRLSCYFYSLWQYKIIFKNSPKLEWNKAKTPEKNRCVIVCISIPQRHSSQMCHKHLTVQSQRLCSLWHWSFLIIKNTNNNNDENSEVKLIVKCSDCLIIIIKVMLNVFIRWTSSIETMNISLEEKVPEPQSVARPDGTWKDEWLKQQINTVKDCL